MFLLTLNDVEMFCEPPWENDSRSLCSLLHFPSPLAKAMGALTASCFYNDIAKASAASIFPATEFFYIFPNARSNALRAKSASDVVKISGGRILIRLL